MKKRKKGYFQVYQLIMFIGMKMKKKLKRKFHLIVTQSVFCNVIFFNIFKSNFQFMVIKKIFCYFEYSFMQIETIINWYL